MALFLIDVNLPYYFSLWNNSDFIHQIDLGDSWTDTMIWEYAKKNKLTIITKDADFHNRIMASQAPPKVIYLKIGNLKIKDFHNKITGIWEEILFYNKNCKLVIVYPDRIEGISSNP